VSGTRVYVSEEVCHKSEHCGSCECLSACDRGEVGGGGRKPEWKTLGFYMLGIGPSRCAGISTISCAWPDIWN
jgi:hypothetical protein